MMCRFAAALMAAVLFGPVITIGQADVSEDKGGPPSELAPIPAKPVKRSAAKAAAPEKAAQNAPASAEVTPEQVRRAIERGVAYLKSQQRRDGGWNEKMIPFPGGATTLCTLALLNAGVEPSEPHVQKALAAIRKLSLDKTYTVSLATMVFARAEPKRDLVRLSSYVKWLEGNQITTGDRKGSWSYPGGENGDNSNSQFALLALYDAERAGVPVSDKTWRLAKNYWEKCQCDDGSWVYPFRLPPGMLVTSVSKNGSMTCAGIASLVITADRIQSTDAKVAGDQIDCCVAGGVKDMDRIERGLQWLDRHFSVSSNPNQPGSWALYYLYGLERAGRLTARRFIGNHDWYREGADLLIRRQDHLSGFWTGVGHAEEDPLIGTSFALLFLSKGRWPVLLGKVKHEPENDWNRHRSDVNNLTRYVESRWRRDLTWQVVDVDHSSLEDLLQTPVLYLCGSQSPLPDQEKQRDALARKLRDYVDRGGFLFAEAYCGETGFDKGFRELMTLVFPEPEYKLRLLEPEHPIWYAEEKVDSRHQRPLWGIDFGCRTSVVYAPIEFDSSNAPKPSLSCLWELSRPGRGEKYSPAAQAEVNAALSIGVNVLAFATNRELKTKEDFFRAKTGPDGKDALERGRISIAKLRHPGGCNAAPRALGNLMEAAGRELKVRTHVREELLDLTDDALFDYPMVFMHGRTAFRLTDVERQRLKSYLERGGMLLADSICASPAFTESFRREMESIFPDRKLERVPAGDPMLTAAYGGFDLTTVSRRDPAARDANGGPLEAAVRKVPPDLQGIKFQDRWGVVFSPYDLSCALEKRDSLECRGYLREDAARIGLNVVLYAMQQ